MWTIQRNNNKNRSNNYQSKIYSITNNNETLTHSLYGEFKATTTKTDQVSTKPKYIKITNKNETLTHILYVDNSKQQHQKQIK